MPNVALEQEVIAAAITIALILCLHASDVHQHSTFNRSWTATLPWGTDIRSRPSTKLLLIQEVDPVVI